MHLVGAVLYYLSTLENATNYQLPIASRSLALIEHKRCPRCAEVRSVFHHILVKSNEGGVELHTGK